MKQTNLVLLLAFQLPLSLLKTAQNHPMVCTIWDSEFQWGPAQGWGHWAKGEVPLAKPASPPVHKTAAVLFPHGSGPVSLLLLTKVIVLIKNVKRKRDL